MTKARARVSTALAAILLTAAATPFAEALDLGKTVRSAGRSVGGALSGGGAGSASLGSGPGGGLSASANSPALDGTNLNINLFGQSGVADVSAKSQGADTDAGAGVLSRGQLASLRLDPNTSVAGGGGAVTPAFAQSLLAGLDRLEQQALKLRCADVLRSPKAFDSELILLCRILASL